MIMQFEAFRAGKPYSHVYTRGRYVGSRAPVLTSRSGHFSNTGGIHHEGCSCINAAYGYGKSRLHNRGDRITVYDILELMGRVNL